MIYLPSENFFFNPLKGSKITHIHNTLGLSHRFHVFLTLTILIIIITINNNLNKKKREAGNIRSNAYFSFLNVNFLDTFQMGVSSHLYFGIEPESAVMKKKKIMLLP